MRHNGAITDSRVTLMRPIGTDGHVPESPPAGIKIVCGGISALRGVLVNSHPQVAVENPLSIRGTLSTYQCQTNGSTIVSPKVQKDNQENDDHNKARHSPSCSIAVERFEKRVVLRCRLSLIRLAECLALCLGELLIAQCSIFV